MDTKRKYSVTVIPDKEGEAFSPSSCTCEVCVSMNDAQLEWDTFIPETNLQRRMKKVVSIMEKRVKKGLTTDLTSLPKYLGSSRKKRRTTS